MLEEPETLDAELLQEEEAEAKAEAGKNGPGLTMSTDGSRLDDGAAGYAVVWKKGQSWVGIKTQMGHNREARRRGVGDGLAFVLSSFLSVHDFLCAPLVISFGA